MKIVVQIEPCTPPSLLKIGRHLQLNCSAKYLSLVDLPDTKILTITLPPPKRVGTSSL